MMAEVCGVVVWCGVVWCVVVWCMWRGCVIWLFIVFALAVHQISFDLRRLSSAGPGQY